MIHFSLDTDAEGRETLRAERGEPTGHFPGGLPYWSVAGALLDEVPCLPVVLRHVLGLIAAPRAQQDPAADLVRFVYVGRHHDQGTDARCARVG